MGWRGNSVDLRGVRDQGAGREGDRAVGEVLVRGRGHLGEFDSPVVADNPVVVVVVLGSGVGSGGVDVALAVVPGK